jgi:hypothetical protein
MIRMIETHEITPWEETVPGVQQRRHTLRTGPVSMEQAIDFTGKLNTSEYFAALPGHLSVIKLTSREDHAIVIILERSLHWCFQRDEEGAFTFQPQAREYCEYGELLDGKNTSREPQT